MSGPIYLDYNATTPVDRSVFDEMAPFFCEQFGNAASTGHSYGSFANDAVEEARVRVASLIGAEPREIIFTSGATEANNLALKGVADHYSRKGDHIVTVHTEHKAVIESCEILEESGLRITYLDVDEYGLVDPEDVIDAIEDETILVSVMTVNNETGVIQPVAEIGKICREHGVLFHSDAVQAVGKIPFDVNQMNVDLVSMSAHKLYGPKGVGALYMRRSRPRAQATPMIDGGGHEDGMRSGTLNVPGIVGFGSAAKLAGIKLEHEMKRILKLRRRLEKGLTDGLTDILLNGHPDKRVPGTVNYSFAGVDGIDMLEALTKIAVSSGAACTTANIEPSHVLSSMGLDYETAMSSIRFSLGRFTTEAEIDLAVEHVIETVTGMRTGQISISKIL